MDTNKPLHNNKILVIGSANADLVIHSPRMPKLGETLSGHNFQINAGGKGLNQAVAIAKLGGNVSFLGAVGTDANGDMLLDTFVQNNISFDGIRTTDIPTGIAMITVVDGNNFIILDPGANNALTPSVLEQYEQLIAESDFCVMQLEIPPETVQRVCALAKIHNTKMILNPAPAKELPDFLFEYIDYLVPNEYETLDLTGIFPDTKENCENAIAKFREMGAKHIIITLGERGCVYNEGDCIYFHPAQKTVAVDTTSAGDCFIGAFVSRLSLGDSITQAITFATKASAIAVSREGASKSIPYAHEITL